ncbi:MAG: hypothetical protein WCX17_00310 [Parcubacteria group bacterium]|jgi:hypothetical protein
MFDKKLKEALELLGGKAILNDEQQYYVVMTLKEFKKMKQDGVEGLTKQELVDKINNDIAIWKVSQEDEEMAIKMEELEESEPEEIHYEKPVA